jgi:hypothetical protein
MNACIKCSSACDSPICSACVDSINDDVVEDRRLGRLIWGLKVMRLYGRVPIVVRHDEFLAGPEGGKTGEGGRRVLKELGWIWSDNEECYTLWL